jgi:tol-pal system protein YbgF
MRRLRGFAAVALLVAAPLAHAGLFDDDEARKKIADLELKVQSYEDRLAKLESTVKSQGLVDLFTQVEGLKADIAKLRGQVEVEAHDIDTAEKRQKDLYVDLDTRLRKLERTGATPGSSTAPVPGAEGAAPAQAGAQTADASVENRSYEAAFNQFKIGNFQGAIVAFQAFIQVYPSSPLASSAQYWIGNSQYALKDYRNAIASQQKLILQYPSSQKVPDAMLNMASSQAESGDKTGASKTLQDLIKQYPLSPAADSAKKRLATLKP